MYLTQSAAQVINTYPFISENVGRFRTRVCSVSFHFSRPTSVREWREQPFRTLTPFLSYVQRLVSGPTRPAAE